MEMGPAAGGGGQAAVSARPGPLDGVMLGERSGTKLWPAEKILPLGLSPLAGLGGRGGAGGEPRRAQGAEVGKLPSERATALLQSTWKKIT